MATSENNPLTTSSSGDTFRCPICLEEVRNPKYLSCLHTFCESCIQTYISSTATCHDSLNSKTIDCPVCRKRIGAPRKDISAEDWASSLSTNKLIVRTLLSTNDTDNQLCKFCERNEKSVPAKNWCKACMETICDECKAFHKLVPILQNHKIDNMVDSKVRGNEVETDEVCPEHEGKSIDAFCHQHRKLCCCICLAKHHRSCQLVEVIADMAVEKERNDVQGIVSTFSDLENCVQNMQLKNQGKKDDLNSSKREICINTDKAIQEIKKEIDDAHATWIKQFEQSHANSIENFEVASDELKRFLTTIRETKILLQFMLEKGSLEQLFVTKQNQLDRIVNHTSRLRSLDIWDFPDLYIEPGYNFRRELLNKRKLPGVKLLKAPSGTIATISRTVQKAFGNNILQRKHEMFQKDWMKVTPKLASKITALPETVCYGLFIHDNIILLPVKSPPSLRLYDISGPIGKCFHNELCQNTPYGLCHSRVNESMNEVYVSFLNLVDLYWIDLEGETKFTKLRSIQINKPMEAISCGLATIISANKGSTFICSKDFVITRTLSLKTGIATVPFVSSSLNSDRHCTTKNRRIVIAEGNNGVVSQSDAALLSLYGITFDLHKNVLVCTNEPNITQHKYGVKESRDIKLDDISRAYNVVLHPTGEKMLVLDYEKKCCVYQIT